MRIRITGVCAGSLGWFEYAVEHMSGECRGGQQPAIVDSSFADIWALGTFTGRHTSSAAGRTKLGPLVFPFAIELRGERWVEPFLRRPVVVLSPHFDDACFSLGSFLAAVGHGDLVNIFTEGAYLARKRPRSAPPLDRPTVYDIRNNEDFAFAVRCGLDRHDLGCEIPSLRGRRTGDMRHIADDVAQITAPVLSTLEKIAGSFLPSERGFLFCPLGIGKHINHRATAAVVLQHLPEITTRYDVLFYEDQPYAANLVDRLQALYRVNRRLHGGLTARYTLTSAWFEKKALISLYPSQLRKAPRRHRFWPAALRPHAPHEAFWSIGCETPGE